MEMRISIPSQAAYILRRLCENNHAAYVVGGCVRDSLMGVTPHDWDICTSALPNEVISIFSDETVIETGVKHGTVTILLERTPYEVTTFRADGEYSDFRKPDSVSFVRDYRTDASRRDFTMNALAYNDKTGLVDYFGGREDIENGIVRCVGDADRRFREDALRIMRAMRFSATLGFGVDPATKDAAIRNRKLLDKISRERISGELSKLVCGRNAGQVLKEYRDVIAVIIPELAPEFGFEQKNIFHDSDVWEHTVRAVEAAPPELIIRLAMLLHDIGKPSCFLENETGGHFYGHGKAGAAIAETVLKRLKFSNDIIKTVTMLIEIHDPPLNPSKKGVLKMLNKLGEENYRSLIAVHRADFAAHSEYARKNDAGIIDAAENMLEEVLREGSCFSLKDLKINGHDVIAAGITNGRQIGAALSRIMDMVISGALPNEREELLKALAELA